MASPCSREKGARKSFCSSEKGALQGQGKGVLGRKPHFTLGSPAVVSLKPASWEINRGLWKRKKGLEILQKHMEEKLFYVNEGWQAFCGQRFY